VKNTDKHKNLLISSTIFTILATTISCNSGSIKTNALDGELVFQTIFLGSDHYLTSIPELEDIHAQFKYLKESDPQIQERINEFWTSLRENIIQENPNYFTEFGRDITSGDHLRIINTLEYAGQVMKSAVQAMPEFQEMLALDGVGEIREILSATNFEEYVDEDGVILKEQLINDLLNKMNGSQGGKYQQTNKQTCVVVAVVFFFFAAAVVEVGGAVAGGLVWVLAAVYASYGAVINEWAFWDGSGGGVERDKGENYEKNTNYSGYKSLKYEMMINSIAQNLSK